MKHLFKILLILHFYSQIGISQFDINTDFKIQGKLGVGIVAPTEKVDIDGNLRVRSMLFCNGSDFILGNLDARNQGTKLGNRALVHTDWGIGADNLNINYDGDFEGGVEIGGPKLIVNGKIGIGIINPTEKVDIDGNLRVRSRLFCNGSDFILGNFDTRNQGTKLGNRALVHTDFGIGTDNLNINYDGDFEGGVENWGPKLIVTGNLGLGEINPIVKLHLSNNDKMRIGPWEFSQEGGGESGLVSYFRIDRYTSDGTTTFKQKMMALDWEGNLHVKKVTVSVDQFPDYVFEKTYKLLPLLDLEKFIIKNKHLPEVPSANEIGKNGMDVGEFNKLLLKKVEELTLHIIRQQKQIDELMTDRIK